MNIWQNVTDLIARIIASHVALATVDAHVRVDQGDNVLFVVWITLNICYLIFCLT